VSLLLSWVFIPGKFVTDSLGVAPAYAVPELLEKTGLSVNDIDVYELNEGIASNRSSNGSVRISVCLLYPENRM
jgi:hypothetical protein